MNNENNNGQNPQYNSEPVPSVMPNQRPESTPVYPQPQSPVAPATDIPVVNAVPYQGPVEQPTPVMPALSQPVTPVAAEPVYPQATITETPVQSTTIQPTVEATPVGTSAPVEPVITPQPEPVMPSTQVGNPAPIPPEPQVTITPTIESVAQNQAVSTPMEPAQSVPIPPAPASTTIQPTVETTPLQATLPPLDALPDHIDVNGNPSPIGPAPDPAPKVRKKSKLPMVLLVLILLIASFLAGQYLANAGMFNVFKLFEKEEKADPDKNDTTKTAMATKIDPKQDYIYVANSYEIERDDTFKKEFAESDMSFKIDTPYINIDNAEMKQLNEKFQKDTETLKQLITYHPKSYSNSDKYLATFTSSDATIYQSNDIASLIVKNEPNIIPGDNSEKEYTAYNIDLKTGKLLENADVLKKYNLDETKVEELAKQKLSDKGVPICDSQTGTTCIDTTPDASSRFNTKVIYVDDNGNVFTIVPLRSGMAILYQTIQLN